jgi:hypothetical protein
VCAQVAGNGFVFGAFTPLSWPSIASFASASGYDQSGRTFLFSLANAHGRAVKLRLKNREAPAQGYHSALSFYSAGNGPGFGNGELSLLHSYSGNSTIQSVQIAYELDHEAESAAGLPPIPFPYNWTLLAGDDGKQQTQISFAAAEIEVYQL